METTFAVQVTKVPGGPRAVLSDGNKTIKELFELAFDDESTTGYQFQVNGSTVEETYIARPNDRIIAAKQIKGN